MLPGSCHFGVVPKRPIGFHSKFTRCGGYFFFVLCAPARFRLYFSFVLACMCVFLRRPELGMQDTWIFHNGNTGSDIRRRRLWWHDALRDETTIICNTSNRSAWAGQPTRKKRE